MIRQPVSVDGLTRAIKVWELVNKAHQKNMKDIKAAHKLTWWARKDYWRNERAFHKGFTAIIKRRIQLATAIKEKENSK